MTHIIHTIPNPAVWPLISHDELWAETGVAPHTHTTRISLTALGGMPSLLYVIIMRRFVVTAPTTYGESGISLFVDGINRGSIATTLSASAPYHNSIERQIMYIPPGSSLNIRSFDSSTGGTLGWRIYCQVVYPYP